MEDANDRALLNSQTLLRPGETCWRTAEAGRLTVLMENDAYFDALNSALGKARRSVVVLGWQFDPRTRLDPETRAGDRQAEIGHLLRMMVKSRPELDVHDAPVTSASDMN